MGVKKSEGNQDFMAFVGKVNGSSSPWSDVQIVVQPGRLAARNYLNWQKKLADLRNFWIFRPNNWLI